MITPEQVDQLIALLPAGSGLQRIASLPDALNLDQVGNRGRTLLMVAAAEGLVDAVKLLLTKGASVSAPGLEAMTPLHEAASNGAFQVVEILVGAGSSVDARTVSQVTPLMWAPAWGQGERTSEGLKRQQNLLEVVQIPTRAESFAADVVFDGGVLLQDRQSQFAEQAHDVWAAAGADAALVFVERHIESVVQRVFDFPVITDPRGMIAGAGWQAADEVRHFGLLSAVGQLS